MGEEAQESSTVILLREVVGTLMGFVLYMYLWRQLNFVKLLWKNIAAPTFSVDSSIKLSPPQQEFIFRSHPSVRISTYQLFVGPSRPFQGPYDDDDLRLRYVLKA